MFAGKRTASGCMGTAPSSTPWPMVPCTLSACRCVSPGIPGPSLPGLSLPSIRATFSPRLLQELDLGLYSCVAQGPAGEAVWSGWLWGSRELLACPLRCPLFLPGTRCLELMVFGAGQGVQRTAADWGTDMGG